MIEESLLKFLETIAVQYNNLIPNEVDPAKLKTVLDAVDEAVVESTEEIFGLFMTEDSAPVEVISPDASRLLPKRPQQAAEVTPAAAPVAPAPPASAPPATVPAAHLELPPMPSHLPGKSKNRPLSDGFNEEMNPIDVDRDGSVHLGLSVEEEKRMAAGLPARRARPHIVVDHSGTREYVSRKHATVGQVAPHARVDAPLPKAPVQAVNPDMPEGEPGNDPK